MNWKARQAREDDRKVRPDWVYSDEWEDHPAFVPATDVREVDGETPDSLKQLPYREYLRSAHWDHMRRRALLRAGFQCQRCERGHMLDVHHLTYDRLGREAEADLVVLCRPCHAKEHGTDDDLMMVVQQLGEHDAMSILKSEGMDEIGRLAGILRKGPVVP